MNELATIHDDCLEYELEIISMSEELTERRLNAYKSGKKKVSRLSFLYWKISSKRLKPTKNI